MLIDKNNPSIILNLDSTEVIGINEDYKNILLALEHMNRHTYFFRIRYAFVSDDEYLKKLVKNNFFDGYRFLDFDTKETFNLSKDTKSLIKSPYKCYDFICNKNCRFNCQLTKVYKENINDYRIETTKSKVLLVYSQCTMFNGKKYIIQYIKNFTHSLIVSDGDSEKSYY